MIKIKIEVQVIKKTKIIIIEKKICQNLKIPEKLKKILSKISYIRI